METRTSTATVAIDRVEALGRVRAGLEGIGLDTSIIDDRALEAAVLHLAQASTVFGADIVNAADVMVAVGNALGGRI